MKLTDKEMLAFAKLNVLLKSGNPHFPQFLEWITERLEHVHKEEPMMDYMQALRRYVAGFNSIQRTIDLGLD